MPLSVLHVASEVSPFAKTGGLADVCSALPRALERAGVQVTVVMPRYRAVDVARHALARRLVPLRVELSGRTEEIVLYEGRLPGAHVSVYLLDHPLFDREGIYGEAGTDYPDNGRRFALLGRGALELVHRMERWPDLVHAHDWQGSLALAYARRGAVAGRRPPATVLTLHNLAFQGILPRAAVDEIDLGWDIFKPEIAEFFGQLNLLKLGIAHADRLTTVSPRYAREIQTPEQGAGLDGFLRERSDRLVGILNGIDTEIWDPARDPHLPVRYDADDRSGKSACKAALQRELGLPVRSGVPLIGQVSRMTEQKGFTLIAEAAEELARLEAQFVFVGKGERRFEGIVESLARRHPARIAARFEYDEPLAHRVEAGVDFFLMPSHFEPCGLNQMYSHRYGTVPIVRATGGLDDTVVDYDERTRTGTGFKFSEYNATAMISSIKRAMTLYRHRDAFGALSSQVMRLDHSWAASARRTLQVYERVLADRKAA